MLQVTQTQAPAQVIRFDNNPPLRTRQEIYKIRLAYAYLDFGGIYFSCCECVREPGSYHAWRTYVSPYDEPSARTYLGKFRDYVSLMEITGEYSQSHQGKIVQWMADGWTEALGRDAMIDVPVC